MSYSRNLLLAGGLLSATLMGGGQAMAQCSRGGGNGMQTGSPTTLGTNSPYSQSPLAFSGYTQGNSLAMQYQQQGLAMQQQVDNFMYQNAQRQRLAMMQREAQARPYRLARAEANRAARAERIAARLREQGRSSDAYMLASVSNDHDVH